jgi:hypothetical protein
MTKRRLAVVPSPPRSADPTRLRLDEAIKAAAKARSRLEAHRAAIQRADEQVTASEQKVEQAQAAAAAAKSAYAGELAQAVAARAATMPGTPRALRDADAKVADAQRTAEATVIARDRLKADLRSVEIETHIIGEVDVAAAVDAALVPSVEKLIALGEQSRVVMWRCVGILNELRAPGGRDPYFRWAESEWREQSDAGKRRDAMIPLRDQIDRLQMRIHYNREAGVDEVISSWRLAVAQLRVDPIGAALPPLPGEET